LAKVFRRSGIEAGGGGRRWQGAPMLHQPARAVDAARATTRARAAALYMNAAQGRRIVEAWTSALVGRGWQARSQHPDRATAARLNDAFEAMANPVLPLIARSLVRDGEAFVHLRATDGRLTVNVYSDGPFAHLRATEDGGLVPVMLDPAQIDPALTRPLDGGARIEQGIELGPDGDVRAYHVLREVPGTGFAPYETVRIPAADMLHCYDPLFPGQVRGLSWLAPVLLKLADRDALADALLMQAKVGALLTGFVRDPEGGAAGFAGEGGAAGALNVALEPGAMRILPPGADVSFSPQPQGLRDATAFLAATDREIAAGAGLTYEQLTGDLGAANYSSARVGLLDFRRRAEALQRHRIEGQVLRPLWRRWIDVQTLAGLIPADPMAQADHRAVRFIGPGFDWIDPEAQVAAEVLAMQNGLKSREEIVAARGRDIDELDAELARDRARRQPMEASP
jgi:lambda family phage portal protein